jgi:hypothetical protein
MIERATSEKVDTAFNILIDLRQRSALPMSPAVAISIAQ